MKPTHVELLREDGAWVPFLLHADGTVYELRHSGDRRVTEPDLIHLVQKQAVVDQAMERTQ